MDADYAAVESELDAKLANFGWNRSVSEKKSVEQELQEDGIIKGLGMSMMDVRVRSRTRESSI